MRFLILIFVWITPAIIAGLLGWKGIWGTGSALFEYLIPLPVAGDVLHLPSFLVAVVIILNLKQEPGPAARFLPLAAVAVFLAVQTLQLDFARFNAWLFTDYAPYKSPFRFGANPVYLFVATDALWVALYARIMGCSTPWRLWLLLPLVPAAVIGFEAVSYKVAGPRFIYGSSDYGKIRGEYITLIYTANPYDERLFRDWWENDSSLARPWYSPNSEHLAVFFSRSLQAARSGLTGNKENIVATFCVYEEDRSLTTHAGYHDCFADRPTLSEKLEASRKTTDTGLGRDVDDWYAGARLCEGVEIPERPSVDIAIVYLCRRLGREYPKLLARFSRQYGEDAAQTVFLRSHGALVGITDAE